jgi:hypothetical protein
MGPKIDFTDAAAALGEAGVADPVRSRLVAEREPEELLLRIGDWQTRRRLGQKLGPAWLVASIRDGYDLHDQTLADRARTDRRREAEAHRAEQKQQAEREKAEIVRVAAEAERLFDELSDEELDHWKAAAIREFGGVARGLHDADPRQSTRLRRLVLAQLSRTLA